MTRKAEAPILFSSAMVRAILAGTKTQTRRVITTRAPLGLIGPGDLRADPESWGYHFDGFSDGSGGHGYMTIARGHVWRQDHDLQSIACPYDADRLWVRETWRPVMEAYRSFVEFSADGGTRDAPNRDVMNFAKMALRFPGARKDVRSEAWHPSIHMPRWASRITLAVESIRVERLQSITEEDAMAEGVYPAHGGTTHAGEFRWLWDSINGKRPGCSWADSPWVWVVRFRVTPAEPLSAPPHEAR